MFDLSLLDLKDFASEIKNKLHPKWNIIYLICSITNYELITLKKKFTNIFKFL